MRHLNSNKKLGRDRAGRKALKKLLASALFLHGKIRTTEAKASFVKPYVEKIITVSQQKNLISKRVIQDQLNKKAALKLRKELVSKFTNKNGGYTRTTKLMNRKGDNAKIVLLELIS